MAIALNHVERTVGVDDQRAMMAISDLAMFQWTPIILETEQIEPQSKKQVTFSRAKDPLD